MADPKNIEIEQSIDVRQWIHLCLSWNYSDAVHLITVPYVIPPDYPIKKNDAILLRLLVRLHYMPATVFHLK